MHLVYVYLRLDVADTTRSWASSSAADTTIPTAPGDTTLLNKVCFHLPPPMYTNSAQSGGGDDDDDDVID